MIWLIVSWYGLMCHTINWSLINWLIDWLIPCGIKPIKEAGGSGFVMVKGVLGICFQGIIRPTGILFLFLLPVICHLFELFLFPFVTKQEILKPYHLGIHLNKSSHKWIFLNLQNPESKADTAENSFFVVSQLSIHKMWPLEVAWLSRPPG